MDQFILQNENSIRLGVFGFVMLSMALWETLSPQRKLYSKRLKRWPNNIGVVLLSNLLVKFTLPILAVEFSNLCQQNGWGLFNFLSVNEYLEIVLAFVIFDLVIYIQHVIFHSLPLLWRLHRMHHSDTDYDFTTGNRFHPIEIFLSMLIKLAAVFLIGPSPLAVIIFEIILNASATFNHGNIKINYPIDKILRLFIVTPDMHRVHHSVIPNETNSNYGFCLPWWDRLFGTYRGQPKDGHEDMTIGIYSFRNSKELRIDRMLTQPFRGEAKDYPINKKN